MITLLSQPWWNSAVFCYPYSYSLHEPVERNILVANRDKVHPEMDEQAPFVCFVLFASGGAFKGARRPGRRHHDDALSSRMWFICFFGTTPLLVCVISLYWYYRRCSLKHAERILKLVPFGLGREEQQRFVLTCLLSSFCLLTTKVLGKLFEYN